MEAAVNQIEVEAYKERLNKRQKFEQDSTAAAAAGKIKYKYLASRHETLPCRLTSFLSLVANERLA